MSCSSRSFQIPNCSLTDIYWFILGVVNSFADPFRGCSATFHRRLSEMSALVAQTVQWEKRGALAKSSSGKCRSKAKDANWPNTSSLTKPTAAQKCHRSTLYVTRTSSHVTTWLLSFENLLLCEKKPIVVLKIIDADTMSYFYILHGCNLLIKNDRLFNNFFTVWAFLNVNSKEHLTINASNKFVRMDFLVSLRRHITVVINSVIN